MRVRAVVRLLWARRYWAAPLAFAVLLVVFLSQHLWTDAVIVGVFLGVFLGFLAVAGRYERNLFDRIKKGELEEDGE